MFALSIFADDLRPTPADEAIPSMMMQEATGWNPHTGGWLVDWRQSWDLNSIDPSVVAVVLMQMQEAASFCSFCHHPPCSHIHQRQPRFHLPFPASMPYSTRLQETIPGLRKSTTESKEWDRGCQTLPNRESMSQAGDHGIYLDSLSLRGCWSLAPSITPPRRWAPSVQLLGI